MLLKPRFGIRMWSGIWPPSKPKTETPERLFWPFWPRPAVLPTPEPMPRPTRTRLLRAPLLSRMSFSFICALAFAFVALFKFVIPDLIRDPWTPGSEECPQRPCSWLLTFVRMTVSGSALDRHHMPHRADHAADLGAVLELRRAVQLVQAQADQRLALIGGAADRRSGL